MTPDRTYTILLDGTERYVSRTNRDGDWVYLIEPVNLPGPELIKIGWSDDPNTRAEALSQQAPFEMRVVTAWPGIRRGIIYITPLTTPGE